MHYSQSTSKNATLKSIFGIFIIVILKPYLHDYNKLRQAGIGAQTHVSGIPNFASDSQ